MFMTDLASPLVCINMVQYFICTWYIMCAPRVHEKVQASSKQLISEKGTQTFEHVMYTIRCSAAGN